jgi:hypothetical protein
MKKETSLAYMAARAGERLHVEIRRAWLRFLSTAGASQSRT